MFSLRFLFPSERLLQPYFSRGFPSSSLPDLLHLGVHLAIVYSSPRCPPPFFFSFCFFLSFSLPVSSRIPSPLVCKKGLESLSHSLRSPRFLAHPPRCELTRAGAVCAFRRNPLGFATSGAYPAFLPSTFILCLLHASTLRLRRDSHLELPLPRLFSLTRDAERSRAPPRPKLPASPNTDIGLWPSTTASRSNDVVSACLFHKLPW